MATVREIQVCGGTIHHSLAEACLAYIGCIVKGTDREKLNFCIVLASGEVKSITIRQEDDRIIAYGDFEGLPDAVEWAKGKEY